MQYKDYYQVLGVPKTATKDEIRKAFRGLARKFHPDVAKDKTAAEAKFKDINEAYEVLGDEAKRREYDELGANWQQRGAGGGVPPGWGAGDGGPSFGGTGFSDFFEQFFGRQRRGPDPFGGMGGQPAKGRDLEADLLVTIEESLRGVEKMVTLRRKGREPETIRVRVPANVREGQKIRLSGAGDAARAGGKSGDLYLRVRLAQHPDFSVEDGELIHELEVAAWQAVLGAELEVPTPDGAVKLKIPAGSQPGKKFRLKGRGLPAEGGGRGDFYVRVVVVLPDSLSADERKAWEAVQAAALQAAS